MTRRSGVHLSTRAARRVALAAQGFARPRPQVPGDARPAAGHRHRRRRPDRQRQRRRAAATTCRSSPGSGPTTEALLDRARDVGSPTGRRVLGARGVPRPAVDLAAAGLPDATRPLRSLGRHAAGRARPPRARRRRARGGRPSRAADQPRGRGRPSRTTCPRQRDEWGWNWSLVKTALEHLFWSGEVSSAGRTTQFERRYALPTRVLPPSMRELALEPGRAPERGGGVPPARRDRRTCPRRGHRAVPARLLPPLARAGPPGDRLPRRRRHARAGDDRGVAAAGIPAP